MKKGDLEVFKLLSQYITLFYKVAYSYSDNNFWEFYSFKKQITTGLKKRLEATDSDKELMMYLHSIYSTIYHIGIFFSPESNGFL